MTTARTLLLIAALIALAHHMHGLPAEVLLALAADLGLQVLRQAAGPLAALRHWLAATAHRMKWLGRVTPNRRDEQSDE